ncbi:hypothetical protein GCM10027062_28070 [Nocardioides hungaricus]
MNSSGIKRGLAGTAVAALAVTGLPFLATSASATPLVEQEAAGNVTLQTPASVASFKNDGVDSTARLVATGGSDVQQVQFQYHNGTAWVNIGSPVSRANGVFSADWSPPASIYNTSVDVRAQALGSVGTEIDTDVNNVLVTANQESVNIGNAAGSQLGYFDQPYAGESATSRLAGISGTTSDVSSNPALTFDVLNNSAAATTEDVAGAVADGATSRTFSAPINLDGYPIDSTDPKLDQALVQAQAGGEDVESVTLYKQTITNVTAEAATPTVQGTNTTDITVTVVDQNGNPVVGAQVVSDDAGVTGAVSGTTTEYTNSRGKAVFEGADDTNGTSAGTTYGFLVNTTDDAGYQSAVDFQRSVTVTAYDPSASSLSAASADGAAFDFDENDSNDIQITVRDQSNAPVPAGTQVSWQWVIAPFDNTVTAPSPINGGGATAANGTVDVAFPTGQPAGTYTLNYWINRDGTPGEGSGDLSGTDLVVKAGNANVVWADDAVAQAPAGTTATFEGSLKLEDGVTGLPGRNLAIAWTKNASGNAVLGAQAAQPAGTTRVSDTAATTTTGADGGFGVAVSDPAVPAPGPQVDELAGDLTAQTTNTTNIGNANDASSLQVDFLKNTAPSTPADIDIHLDDLINGMATPGRPMDLDVTVSNSDGTELTDYPVTVSVDRGLVGADAESESDLVPDPAAAEGGAYGEWKFNGTSQELTTDDGGETGTIVGIEKDDLFRTQSTVPVTVTIKAGNVTTTQVIDFTSQDPLNGGNLSIELDDQQSVSVLPKAPTTEAVGYNVFTTDQFGNLVDNESVDLTDDLAGALVNGSDSPTTVNSQLASESPSIVLSSGTAGSQKVSGEWDTVTNTYTDGDTSTPGFQPSVVTKPKTATATSAAVDWYAIDFANSVYSLTHTGADTQPVGTTVTETYKAVDQNGEPISGLDVEFFRTGPDDLGDGDGNSGGTTNAQGETYYVFQGAKAGTATTTAVVYMYNGTDWVLVPQAEQTDVVKFRGTVNDPNLKVTGKGKGKDRVKADAISAAAGAKATLWVGGKKVASRTLNGSGNAIFTVKDKNGNKPTKYTVKITSTSKTTADQASKRIR